jgi:hypothetical protein
VQRRWLALGIALACAGCPKKDTPAAPPPAPQLAELRVVDKTRGEVPVALDVASITTRVRSDLAAANLMPLSPDGGARDGIDYKLQVSVELAWGDRELRALVEAKLSRIGAAPGEPPIVSRGGAARAIEEKTDRALALHVHVERLTDDVMKSLAAQAKLHLGGSAELAAALAGNDPDLIEEATRVAAQKKDRAAVPALIAILSREDDAARDRALGALIEIGDRRAVKPITELSRFRDIEQMPKIIDAVASLGGDEAKAYLEFVASGHDDPEVRNLAKEALARLVRRSDGK